MFNVRKSIAAVFILLSLPLISIGWDCPNRVSSARYPGWSTRWCSRSGEPFPSGLEIHAIVEALEPLDDAVVDKDLWALLGWTIGGVGAPWTVEDLHATGRLYRIPAAG